MKLKNVTKCTHHSRARYLKSQSVGHWSYYLLVGRRCNRSCITHSEVPLRPQLHSDWHHFINSTESQLERSSISLFESSFLKITFDDSLISVNSCVYNPDIVYLRRLYLQKKILLTVLSWHEGVIRALLEEVWGISVIHALILVPAIYVNFFCKSVYDGTSKRTFWKHHSFSVVNMLVVTCWVALFVTILGIVFIFTDHNIQWGFEKKGYYVKKMNRGAHCQPRKIRRYLF